MQYFILSIQAASGGSYRTIFRRLVHSFYRRARLSGLWDKILENMVRLTRKNAGLDENPTVALVDSQSVQNASASEQAGYDA